MALSEHDMRRRFHERGLKMTPQRAAIYQALVETDSHPTADELYRKVKRLYPTMSPNTVYYNLGVLQAAGLVHEVNYWHDRSRFDGNVELHHHLICLGCRRIQDVIDHGLDRLRAPAHAAGFDVIGHRVEFQGYCAACRRAAARPRRPAGASSGPVRPHRPPRGGHHG